MFGFLKKFFGMDKETLKEANVQLEQPAPYKVEPPLPEPTPAPVPAQAETVVIKVVEEKPAKAKRKPAARKTTGEKKPRAKRSKNT